MSDSRPILWHIELSHFSEKARWALAYKGIEHERRAPLPGMHMAVALFLTRGTHKTFPVIQIDGRTVADSTDVIAALEDRFPEPPLYPADAEQRRRALELEDHFDEQLGPHVRRLGFHELRNDRERMRALMTRTAPGPLRSFPAATAAYARTYTNLRFGAGDAAAAAVARTRIVEAFDRLERELDGNEYLVGESFSVADLTAAALLNPIVLPDGGPIPNQEPAARGIEEFREPLLDREGFRWVREMYARHRKPAPAAATA